MPQTTRNCVLWMSLWTMVTPARTLNGLRSKTCFRELEQGTINCILVKDLSRFGRNYIEVGRYLERIFPVMRVRLIAVTDNYDSQSAWKTSDSIMVPMRNLLNDAYCRDISVKIKSQLAVKRKRGDFVGSFATYLENRAAEIVKAELIYTFERR